MGSEMMAIATTVQFWTSRMNGANPESPADTSSNLVWIKTGAGSPAASGGAWRVSNNEYKVIPTSSAYTLLACLNYEATPNTGETILFLDNGVHSVSVNVAAGGKFSIVGATTKTSHDLDPDMTEDIPVPVLLRLTLTAAGVATLYMREIVEDDDGADHFLQVTAVNNTSGAKKIEWGNGTGTIDWNNVYASTDGSFSPNEMAISDFTSDTLLRMGFQTVDILQNSARTHLKNFVNNSAILYGFDLSAQMISRTAPPSIHVLLKNVNSPEFAALSGTRIDQLFDVQMYITTRGTNYKNAYRLGVEIAGDCFDELYKTTGLNGTTDSLISYDIEFNSKMDDDDVVCVHVLTMRYMRRLNMLHR
tara:strand:- start:134 stop:1219 length:1086 start_codon:yes stop_codon:yes gene_type:complete